jgi:hypothetical protein
MANPLNRSTKLAIHRQLRNNKSLINETRILIEKQFKTIHAKFMADFESHPVTRELKGGAGSSNHSNSLPQGNLFGFIGFQAGADPVFTIENMLRRADIMIKNRKMGSFGFVWTYIVTTPSLEELYSATPMPWATGSSWLRELEGRGIPNLGQYMYKRSTSSRSGAGVQNENRRGGGRVRVSYVKQLLKEFEQNLNSIQASRVSKVYF